MNNQNNNQGDQGQEESLDAAKKAGKEASKKAAKAAKFMVKVGSRILWKILMLLIRFWWITLPVILFIIVMFTMMYFISSIGGGLEESAESNPCTTGINSRVDNKATVKSAKNPSSILAIKKLAPTARKLAPKVGIPPSLVLADAGMENPTGPGYNYWGVGFYDHTTANNQSYDNLEQGMNTFLNTAIDDTKGHVQTKDPQRAMEGMANADGKHPPLQEYHSDNSADYLSKLEAQYHTYHLSKYDDGVKINTHIKKGTANVQANADNANDSGCGSDNTNTTTDGIYNYAERFDGQIPYDQNYRYEFGNDLPKPKSSDRADCSSFVWGVLKGTGYKVNKTQWTTEDMVKSPNLKHINGSEAKQGDILVIPSGNKAHAMILASKKWYGEKSFKSQVIDEGGMEPNVNQSNYQNAMGGLIKPTFLRAIKE